VNIVQQKPVFMQHEHYNIMNIYPSKYSF